VGLGTGKHLLQKLRRCPQLKKKGMGRIIRVHGGGERDDLNPHFMVDGSRLKKHTNKKPNPGEEELALGGALVTHFAEICYGEKRSHKIYLPAARDPVGGGAGKKKARMAKKMVKKDFRSVKQGGAAVNMDGRERLGGADQGGKVAERVTIPISVHGNAWGLFVASRARTGRAGGRKQGVAGRGEEKGSPPRKPEPSTEAIALRLRPEKKDKNRGSWQSNGSKKTEETQKKRDPRWGAHEKGALQNRSEMVQKKGRRQQRSRTYEEKWNNLKIEVRKKLRYRGRWKDAQKNREEVGSN